VVASVVLLLAVAASFLLPWSRLPAWMTVLVPLAYTGSVLSLILAAGPTSGVGVVILIPLIWTALFHRGWESACIVATIVAVEVIISLAPVAVADAVIARRLILWASLGTVISIATHSLRDRIRRSQEEAARAQERLRDLTVLQDRDRVAADLQDKVIQRVFATGLTLQGAAALTAEPEVRRRVEASVEDLDHVLRILRDTIFGLDQHLQRQGFRREIVGLCGQLSPAPELSFSGPVDGALHPVVETQLVEILREALAAIGQHATPSRIEIAAEDSRYVTVIEAALLPHAVKTDGPVDMFSSLQDSAARAGIRADIEPVPDGIRFAWHVPMNPAAAGPPNAPIRPIRRSEFT
jgi:signal transduction histidine kinase